MKYIILCIITFFYFSPVFGGELHVDKKQDNEVKFLSEVTILTFEGITDQIDGYIYWDGDEFLTGKSQVYFEVDLNALETGIGKRDRDMREVLKTDKYRYTIFDGQISQVKKNEKDPDSYTVKVSGQIFIHGVNKEMEIDGIISKEKDKINIKSQFKVYLDQHEIEAPSLAAFVKVNNEINLELNFYVKEIKK